MRTPQLANSTKVATYAFVYIAFQAACKRRPRNRPYRTGYALSGVIKNSAKEFFHLHCADA